MVLECEKYFYVYLSKLLYKYNIRDSFEKMHILIICMNRIRIYAYTIYMHIFVKKNNEIWTKWFMYI